MRRAIVVTTVNKPTNALINLAENSTKYHYKLIVVGDRKTPSIFSLPNSVYLGLDEQKDSMFKLGQKLPENTYTRKMLGYLEAIRLGASWIQETDDDNYPYADFLTPLEDSLTLRLFDEIGECKWINPLKAFTDFNVWPRGIPISEINSATTGKSLVQVTQSLDSIGCVQDLADGNPDVDAIFRMLYSREKIDITFDNLPPLLIPRDKYAPFNSQATWIRAELAPLMYLPVTCTFRMTDIWRSFIFQRILRETRFNFIYRKASVVQIRNPHNLMVDFEQEIDGHLRNSEMLAMLDNLSLLKGVDAISENLQRVYSCLIGAGFVRTEEQLYLDCWLSDLEKIYG